MLAISGPGALPALPVREASPFRRTWKKYGHFSQAIATRTYFNTFFNVTLVKRSKVRGLGGRQHEFWRFRRFRKMKCLDVLESSNGCNAFSELP